MGDFKLDTTVRPFRLSFDNSAAASAASAAASAASAAAAAASAAAASTSAGSASASATSAQNWATQLGAFVTGSLLSAQEWAVGTFKRGVAGFGSAKDWAILTGAVVDDAGLSAKEWAIGVFKRGVAGFGSAKDWAILTGTTVDGTNYSALKNATDAAASATAASGYAGIAIGASTAIMTTGQVAAATVPAAIISLRTTGLTGQGQGPGGDWARRASVPGHTGYIQDAASVYFETIPGDKGVNARALGAKADGVTVDNTALGKAESAGKALGAPVWLAPSTLGYIVTTSRNFTYAGASGTPGYSLVGGEGPDLVHVSSDAFSENYPILDFAGNSGGRIKGISVIGNGSSCQASCVALLAQNTNSPSGNNIVLEDVNLGLPYSGYHANNKYALVAVNTDLSILVRVKATGPGGIYARNVLPSGVTSKQFTPSPSHDTTKFTMRDCIAIGSTRPAVTIGDYARVHMDGGYFAVVTDGATPSNCIIKIPSGMALTANAIRTENQAGTSGMAVFRLDADAGGWDIGGELNTDVAGPLFSGAGRLIGATLNIESSAASPLFETGFVYQHVDLNTETLTNLGQPGSASFGLRVRGGGIDANAIQTYAPKHWDIHRNDGTHKRSADSYKRHRTCTADMREVALLQGPVSASVPYTGGSGEVAIYTYPIPAGILTNSQDNGGVATNGLRIRLKTETTAAFVASGARVRLKLSDGTNIAYIYDSDNGAPFNLPNNGFKSLLFEILLFNLSATNGMREEIEGWAQGVHFDDRTTLQSFGITSVNALTLSVLVTNSANNPLAVRHISALWAA